MEYAIASSRDLEQTHHEIAAPRNTVFP
jgi:hypothetical protein